MADVHTVAEGVDVQLVQQGSLSGVDLISLSQQRHGVDNFNLGLVNLGGDVQSLEERGLTGIATSRSSRDNDVHGGQHTNTGGGGHLVRQNDLTHLSHISVHEDQTNVSVDHIQNLLDGMTRMLVDELADARTDHGLLSEQEDGLSAEGLTDISNLLRADVLDISNEQLAVILEDLVELDEVELLLLSSRHLSLHDVWDG